METEHMANGYTSGLTIGTTEQLAVVVPDGMLADITIQNLSANDLYYGAQGGLSTSSGLKVVPNGSVEILARIVPLSLVASGASSDVRIDVEFYRKGEK